MTGIEVWCNGNTQDFGSWIGGSIPPYGPNFTPIVQLEEYKTTDLMTRVRLLLGVQI